MDNNFERNEQNQDTGYVNVGSSGTNTANTSDAGYSHAPGGAYTYSYGQTGQNSQSGAYDYSGHYTDARSQPRNAKPPRKPFDFGKWGMRGLALVLCGAVGFGGGYAGALVAGRNQPQVVTQTVERVIQPSSSGNTNGTVTVEGDLKDVAAAISPSVVVITTEAMVTSNSWFGGQFVQSGAGSGVIFSEDGYILTCNHVVSGASSIKVTTTDDTEYTATLVGGDSRSDIAVLKIDAEGLTPAVIGDSDELAVGEATLAVGNPLGRLGGTVTNGIVSALNRNITVESQSMTLIQTNAAISPGNSGGGLFNAKGELIGITNAKNISSSAEGLSFAIPVNTAYEVAQSLIENGYVTGRPAMGVTVVTVSTTEDAMRYGVSGMGVYIASVNEGSGAADAGVQVGDRIVSVDDVMVERNSDVTNYLSELHVGDTVRLQVARDGKLLTLEVLLGESAPTTSKS